MEVNIVTLPSPEDSEIDPTVIGLCCLFCGTKFISAGGSGVWGHDPCEHVISVYSHTDDKYEYVNSRFRTVVDKIVNESSEGTSFPIELWTQSIDEDARFTLDSMMFVEFVQMDGYVNGPIVTVGFDLATPESGDEK